MDFDYHNHNISVDNSFTSIKLEDFKKIREKQLTFQNKFFFLEYHPWTVGADFTELTEEFIKTAKDERIYGLGEIGLDRTAKYIDNVENQIKCFRAILELAEEIRKPVQLHVVKSWHIARELLRGYKIPKIYIHGYLGKVELLREMIDYGCFVSLNRKMWEREELNKFLESNPKYLKSMGAETDSYE